MRGKKFTALLFHFRWKMLLFGLLVSALPFRLYNFSSPLLDAASFRQAQTATVVKNYYESGINLLRSELDILGIGRERFLTLEFPLYEAIVSQLYMLFFPSVTWGRSVSIIFGLIGAYFLFLITVHLLKKVDIAILSTFFFLFAPLNIFYQRAYLIESTVVAFLLIGFYAYLRWIELDSNLYLLIGITFLSVGFIQKGVYGPFWLLPLFIGLIQKKSFSSIFKLKSIMAFTLPLFFLLLWQNHVNNINSLYGNDYFTTYNRGHMLWNFGSLSDRLNWSFWFSRLQQILDGILLKPGTVLLVIGLIAVRKNNNQHILISWLGASLIYFITLFRIQSHNYYQMVMVPPFAIFMGIGAFHLAKQLSFYIQRQFQQLDVKKISAVLLIAGCVAFGERAWMFARWSFAIENSEYQRIIEIKKLLPSGPGVFVLPGYDWNSVFSYYLEKKLLAADASELTQEQINLWRKTGYTFLMLNRFPEYRDYYIKKNIIRDISFIETMPDIIIFNDLLIVPLKSQLGEEVLN